MTYKLLSKFYDLIDIIYFTNKGKNPRKAILNSIPDSNVNILDMCCGTMSNSIGIAKNRQNAKIIGIDISSEMLSIAKNKIIKGNISNVEVHKRDATNTKFCDDSFDIVILALVLHETEEVLARQILDEVRRIMKSNGRLLILEWEKSESLLKRIVFLPIKILEPKSFKSFFTADKSLYFKKCGYRILQEYHCDYSCVYELKKY